MKKSKKFVVAGLVLLAAITGLLALTGCKTDVDTSSPQQEQPGDTDNGNNDNDASVITTGDPAAFITEITAAGTYTLVATKECTDTAAIKDALRSLESRQPDARIHLNLSQSGITSIGNDAFRGCSSLASVKIPSLVTSIGNDAFRGCSSLASVEIPSSVTSIKPFAFNECSSLASVTFQAGSQCEIGEYAFDGCSSLVSVEIPSSVTSIGKYAFRGCSGLDSVTFQDGSQLASIGNYAFACCSSLASVKIPTSVKSIGDEAFAECSKLSTVKVEAEDPPILGVSVFEATDTGLKIQVPNTSAVDYISDWSAYEDKIVAITP